MQVVDRQGPAWQGPAWTIEDQPRTSRGTAEVQPGLRIDAGLRELTKVEPSVVHFREKMELDTDGVIEKFAGRSQGVLEHQPEYTNVVMEECNDEHAKCFQI